jgi:hypothetical protein
MSDKKVYIVSDGGHDYSDARRFGELVFLTDAPVRKDDIHLMHDMLKMKMQDATADDFLIVSGLTSLCMVATFIQAAAWGEVNLLVINEGKYQPKRLFWTD